VLSPSLKVYSPTDSATRFTLSCFSSKFPTPTCALRLGRGEDVQRCCASFSHSYLSTLTHTLTSVNRSQGGGGGG